MVPVGWQSKWREHVAWTNTTQNHASKAMSVCIGARGLGGAIAPGGVISKKFGGRQQIWKAKGFYLEHPYV